MRTTSLCNELPAPRPLEDLEDEIATLSATIHAATFRLLCLIGEYDQRSGWADPLASDGFRSCAHWLSYRVGLDLGAAREQVRVARALPALPILSEAFSRGEVSYSKVRALTRIATPENEETLLGWARSGTASQIERLVRTFRRANRVAESFQAEVREQSRSLTVWFDHDGMLVVRGRLAPEQGALLMKALEVAKDELYARERVSAESAPENADPQEPGSPSLASPSPASPSPASPSPASPSPASPSPAPASPAPASPPAVELHAGQRLADALALVAERSLAAASAEASATDRFQVVVHVDAEVLADPDADGRCELEDGAAIAAETARRLACDGAHSTLSHGPQGELAAGRKSRAISAPIRRALRARDGTRCAFPGCQCRARDGHHVKHWAEGGPTVLPNLLSMCKYHHFLVHEGGWRVEASPEGSFRFLRPDGRELAPAPSVPAVLGDPAAALCARWIPPEATITSSTGRPTWPDEDFDIAWAVEDPMARAEGTLGEHPPGAPSG